MIPKRIHASATLMCSATPENPGSAGKILVGASDQTISYDPSTHYAFTRRIRMFGNSVQGECDLEMLTNSFDPAFPYSAPIAQVETATAAGTITTSGSAVVTVTAAGLTGSPITLSVPVLIGDTAATWAGKVRTALAANAAIAALFVVGGTTTAISLTRIIDDAGVANDATLNIALANGTSAGITAAPTSNNTTTGSAATGSIADGDNAVDAEGMPLPTLSGIVAVFLQCVRGNASGGAELYGFDLSAEDYAIYAKKSAPLNGTLLSCTPSSSPAGAEILVTVVGILDLA